jgi:predicted RNase H-like nuclease (RuvC/YqgF family)
LQREKAVEELNVTYNNLEETERKYQSMLKEKDKMLAEEKVKFIRKLEQSTASISEYEGEVAELRGDIEELIKEKLLFIDRIAELEVVLTNEKQFTDHLSQKLKAATDISSSYES